jgi:hypothetical protein
MTDEQAAQPPKRPKHRAGKKHRRYRERLKQQAAAGTQPEHVAHAATTQPPQQAGQHKVKLTQPPIHAGPAKANPGQTAILHNQPGVISTPRPRPGQPAGESGAALAGTSPSQPTAQEGPAEAQAAENPDTRLFEYGKGIDKDAKIIARARRERWKTDPKLAALVVQKLAHKALGLKWKNADGEVEAPEVFTPHQLGVAATIMLNVERMNQAEDHHVDRMEYADKALMLRGSYNPAVRATAKVAMTDDETGKSVGMAVQIYLPSNGRDDLELVPEPRLPGEA